VAYFAEEVGLENISNPKMRLLMELRLSHEDASLEELANLMSEELASTVTKSNVNHLFRAIHQKYEETHGTK
jgi:DNA-binding transcriptional regulator WhiA